MADDECLQLDDSQCAGQAAGAVTPLSSAAAVARGTAVAQQPALPLTAPPAHCAALAPTVPAATTTTSSSSSAAPTSTGVSAVALLIQQQQQQQQQPLAVSRSSSLRLPSHPVVTALSLPPAVRAAAVQSASAAQQSASSVAARFANVAAAAPVAASAAAEPPQLPPSTSAILSLVAAAASAAANNNSNNNSNARASSVALPKGGRLTNEGRQFPGPLGLVRDGSEPITKRRREEGDMQENTLSVVEAEPVAASKSSSVGAAAAQDAAPAAAPSFDAAQPLSQDDLWVSSQWLRALQLCEAPPFGQRQLDHCIRWVLLEGWWRSCPLLVVAVTQLQALHHDATVELKDPTATMRAVIHRDVMEGPTGTQIEAGTVLVLRNVSVFSTSPTERFLNVVPETIVHLLSAASCADCNFAELPEAYQPSLIYSRIPTRLKRPSSGGDKAKKKDTPKPAKPNNSSNNSAKRNNNSSNNNNNNSNKYQRNNGNNNNNNNNSAYGGGRGRGTSAAPTSNKGRGSPLRANTKATSVSSSSSAIPSAFSGSNLRATQFFASAPPPASSAPVSTTFTTSSFLNGPPVVAPAPLLPHQTVSIPPAAAVAPVQPVAAAQAWEDDSIFADVDLDSIVAAAKKK